MFNDLYCLTLLFHDSRQALSLRFTRLVTQNGFKRTGTVQVIYSNHSNQNANKIALKEVFDLPKGPLSSWTGSAEQPICFGQNRIHATHSQGSVHSKTNSIAWNLTCTPLPFEEFHPIPTLLKKLRLMNTEITTGPGHVLVEGTVAVNGTVIAVHQGSSVGHGHVFFRSGTEQGHTWVAAHSNQLRDARGALTDCIFEGLSMKIRRGPFITPQFSSFMFYYLGNRYAFNRLKDWFLIKSKTSLNDWQFEANQGDLTFRGLIRAQHQDSAGFTCEDTDGSFLYAASTPAANMSLSIYRKGKLETTLSSEGTTSFEIASKNKNPYVPILL